MSRHTHIDTHERTDSMTEEPPPSPAERSSSPGRCGQHQTTALGACSRCGNYYCHDCADATSSQELCAGCDRLIGDIPWERERSRLGTLRAYGRTVLRLTVAPSGFARGLPTEGPLGPPAVFAALSCTFYLIMSSLMVGAVSYHQFSLSLARFGAEDSLWRIFLHSYPAIVGPPLLHVPFTVLVTPLVLSAATRLLGARLSLRASARTILYATGYYALAGIPFGAIASTFLFPFFVSRVLQAQTQLPPRRRILAITLLLASIIPIGIAADTIYGVTVDPLVDLGVDRIITAIESREP